MEELEQLIIAYELDPNHRIMEAHIKERQRCVLLYGGDAVRDFIREVYCDLLPYVQRAKLGSYS